MVSMNYLDQYNYWLNNPNLSKEGYDELSSIKDPKDLEYRFGAELKFGTAGMRGLIGMGTNMMNVYTVKRATFGLGQYILSLDESQIRGGVVISYDTRRKSTEFALAAAGVLKRMGIKVSLYAKPRPVPMLSYAVRALNCVAGIMITASHNPKEYNGYKVYGGDGAQMSPEATKTVVSYISETKDYFSVLGNIYTSVCDAEKDGVFVLREDFEQSYYAALSVLTLSKTAVENEGKNIKLVYTPVHGSGYEPVITILKRIGINATVVPEQVNPDTEFSTVEVPNPEYKETLSMGIALANKINADVVFGTDPDCDRLGVALRNDEGEFEALSGNQVGILLLNYILLRLKETGKIKDDSFAVKSFVSTGLAKAITDDFGVALMEVPVGFKFIGEKIKNAEITGHGDFVFGFEESCGYLRGTHARDKDAVVASMLFAELVCYYKSINVSVFKVLNDIYAKYGYCLDKTISIGFKGLNAMDEMNAAVLKMSTRKIDSVGGIGIAAVRNYETGERILPDGAVEKIEFSGLNCLYYELVGGGFICLRPSGTEPKLKIYYSVCAQNPDEAQIKFDKASSSFEKLLYN